jgi:hypothetical protein
MEVSNTRGEVSNTPGEVSNTLREVSDTLEEVSNTLREVPSAVVKKCVECLSEGPCVQNSWPNRAEPFTGIPRP